MKRSRLCGAHVHNATVPIETHHIEPKEYGGKTEPDNLVKICSNAHGNVHYFIGLLLKHAGKVPMTEARTFGIREREIAAEGYRRIVAKLPSHQLADIIRREVTYTLEEAA